MQDLGPEAMQIEVVDDASTDDNIESIVYNIGKGRISYYRHAQNVGSLKNFEMCINRAKGRIIHLLHGDDRVRDGYYTTMNALFKRYPSIGAAFCRYAYINEKNDFIINGGQAAPSEGILNGWLYKIAERQRTQCCAVSVKRTTYEKLGSFYGVNYGEDWEMWARIASYYPVAYTPEVLAEYRRHNNSISSRSFLDGQYMQDLNWVIAAIQEFLPETERLTIKKKSTRFYAHYALRVANRLWETYRSKKLVLVQMREAVRMHPTLLLSPEIVKLFVKMLIQ